MHDIADTIDSALLHVLKDKDIHTRDLGGTATTTEFTEAIVKEIESGRH